MRKLATWCLGLLALAASALAGAALQRHAWPAALGLDVLGAVCGAYCAARTARPRGRPAALEWGLSLGVPVVGWLVVWLLAVYGRWNPRGMAGEEYLEYIDAKSRLGGSYAAPRAQRSQPHPYHLEPVVDILQSGATEDDKRKAVEGLMQLETPEAVRVLKGVVARGTTELRFYAVTALNRLDERLARRLQALEQETVEGPWALGRHHLELGRAHFDHAYFHLAEWADTETHLEQAVEHALKSWQNGGSSAALTLRGRALLTLQRYPEAETAFSEYLEREGADAKTFLWRAEARFYQGRYQEVREDCARARAAGGVPAVLREVVDMWITGARAAVPGAGASGARPTRAAAT